MGSTRLPGKILESICGRPLLEHILERLDTLRTPARIVVATTKDARDDVVEAFCRARPVECFRGSESDVLERYYLCARQYGFDHVVRLTADNPFVDIEELDRLIELHLSSGNDFTYSFEGLPIGVGAEIFAFSALEASIRKGNEPHHREHVDEYVLENLAQFRSAKLDIPPEKSHPQVRLTVDTPGDLVQARRIAAAASGPWATTEEAIRLCSGSA